MTADRREGDGGDEEDYERAAFGIQPLASLPRTGVDIAGWDGAGVDWRSVADVAVELMNAHVDPLDEDEVRRLVVAAKLRRNDREWAIQLFTNPIGIYAESRNWVDGRHRVEAMRQAGVEMCVLKVLT
jgi:hypothetical protein